MTERWQREVAKLHRAELPGDLWERITEGPRLQPPPPRSPIAPDRRGDRARALRRGGGAPVDRLHALSNDRENARRLRCPFGSRAWGDLTGIPRRWTSRLRRASRGRDRVRSGRVLPPPSVGVRGTGRVVSHDASVRRVGARGAFQ